VRYFCHRIVVMYLGRVVEILPDPTAAPRHPYTRALMESTFEPDPRRRRTVTLLHGEIADAFNLPAGCAYAARCPQATQRCRSERPALIHPDGVKPGHSLACHHPLGA
jgi:oligopeptide/dipeptide ABC transporter ATP-binding protein